MTSAETTRLNLRSRGVWRIIATPLLLCAALAVHAGVLVEDFSGNPLARGWVTFGEASLFAWNSTNQNLVMTWDSSRTNSYFYHALGTVLAKSDDFSFAFDLRLNDIAAGTTAGKNYTFEIALGLLNWRSATNANFFRGAGQGVSSGPRNLVEFDYFPAASAVSATFSPTVATSNNLIAFSHNFPLEWTTGDLFRVALSYTASNQTLRTTVTRNGLPFGLPPTNYIKDLVLTNYTDFRVDGFSVSSYSDARQSPPQFAGSVRAHGVLDNVVVVTPDPPVMNLRGGFNDTAWQVRFTGQSNWVYALARSQDLSNWNTVSPWKPGANSPLTLDETNSAAGPAAFYRVLAERP